MLTKDVAVPAAAAPAVKTSATKSLQIYIDGEFFDQADAKVSVFDHGLLYGDGIFEGIRFYNGRVFRMEAHMTRLWESARSICLEIPISREEMDEALLETSRQNGLRDGYVRLIVTRGVGNLGLNPVQCKRPSIIIIATTVALYSEENYRRGLTVVTVATRRMGPATLNPAIKSLNYLNNVLARIEANLANADEALMLNDTGNVAECTADNVFIVRVARSSRPRSPTVPGRRSRGCFARSARTSCAASCSARRRRPRRRRPRPSRRRLTPRLQSAPTISATSSTLMAATPGTRWAARRLVRSCGRAVWSPWLRCRRRSALPPTTWRSTKR